MKHRTLTVVLICVISVITAATTSFAQEKESGYYVRSAYPYLSTEAGRASLETEDGRAFLKTEDGRAFLKAEAGRAFLETKAGRAFLKTEDGRAFLKTEDGRAFLKAEETRAFLKKQEGRAPYPYRKKGADHPVLKVPEGGNYLYVQRVIKEDKKVRNPDALVFSGGGASGVAYAGVLNYLEKSGKLNNVTRYMGASAGAIFSYLFYLGMTPTEVDELYKKIDWKSFMDNRGGFDFFDLMKKLKKPDIELQKIWLPVLSILTQWWKAWGIAPGDVIENTMRQVLIDRGLSDDGYISFADLKAKLAEGAGGKQLDLYIVAYSTCHYKTCIFSAKRSPDMDVVTAIRASMSIPLVFDPVEVKDKDGNTDYLVDGGTTNNYPIEYMEDVLKAHPLGFLLGNKDDYTNPKYDPIETFGGFVGHIFWGLFDNIGPRMEGNLYRTVFIDTPTVGTLDFDMTPADRKAAVDAGYKATLKYFQ